MLFSPAPRYVRFRSVTTHSVAHDDFCRSNNVVTGSNLTHNLYGCIRVCVSVIFCDRRCRDGPTKCLQKKIQKPGRGKAAAVLDLQRQTERKLSSHNWVIRVIRIYAVLSDIRGGLGDSHGVDRTHYCPRWKPRVYIILYYIILHPLHYIH